MTTADMGLSAYGVHLRRRADDAPRIARHNAPEACTCGARSIVLERLTMVSQGESVTVGATLSECVKLPAIRRPADRAERALTGALAILDGRAQAPGPRREVTAIVRRGVRPGVYSVRVVARDHETGCHG